MRLLKRYVENDYIVVIKALNVYGNLIKYLTSHSTFIFQGVMVSTQDSEFCDLSTSLGGT